MGHSVDDHRDYYIIVNGKIVFNRKSLLYYQVRVIQVFLNQVRIPDPADVPLGIDCDFTRFDKIIKDHLIGLVHHLLRQVLPKSSLFIVTAMLFDKALYHLDCIELWLVDNLVFLADLNHARSPVVI